MHVSINNENLAADFSHLGNLEEAFPQSRVIRVMPNTPTLVGAGIAALAPGRVWQHLEKIERIDGSLKQLSVGFPEAAVLSSFSFRNSGREMPRTWGAWPENWRRPMKAWGSRGPTP